MYKIQEPNLSSCVVQEPFVRFSANPQKEFDCMKIYEHLHKLLIFICLNDINFTIFVTK